MTVRNRVGRDSMVVAALSAILLLASGSLWAQATGGAGTSSVPRTPWGDPDLQGIWNFGTVTPLERPDEFADRERPSTSRT